MKMIALVDCNNFFVSCERVFNPSLLGKPVIVLSSNDGCIISMSDEAKRLGIKMEPFFQVKDFCHQNNVSVLSTNYPLYSDMSSRIMTILEEFTKDLEIYSIDEAFLDLSNIPSSRLDALLVDIRYKILKDIGVPVSIGASSTKTLAKIAQNFARDNSSTNICKIISEEEIDKILSITNVKAIWGIGPRSANILEFHGIRTALDFKYMSSILVKQSLKLHGQKIQHELKGIGCFEIEQIHEIKKTITISRSFAKNANNIEDLEYIFSNFIAEGALKLRKQLSLCSALSIFIKTNRFIYGKQLTKTILEYLPYATNDTFSLIFAAKKLLHRIFQEGYSFKKAGISLLNLSNSSEELMLIPNEINTYSNLYPTPRSQHITHLPNNILPCSAPHHINELQADVFLELAITAKNLKVENVNTGNLQSIIDSINQKSGKSTIFYLAQGVKQSKLSSSNFLSRNYTTKWSELIEVK